MFPASSTKHRTTGLRGICEAIMRENKEKLTAN